MTTLLQPPSLEEDVLTGVGYTRTALSSAVFVTDTPPGARPTDLYALRRDDLQVLYVTASVESSTLADVAITVLKALGKRQDVSGMREQPVHNVTVTPCWLAAYRTKLIIIGSAQVWDDGLLRDTLRLLTTSTATVLLVPDPGLGSPVWRSAEGFAAQDIDWSDIHRLVPHRHPHHDQPEHTSKPKPELNNVALPVCDWPTFRHDCRELLPPETFEQLDKVYRRSFTATRSHLTANPHPTKETTRKHLIGLLDTSANMTEATTALRASQAAHFEAGHSLRINVERLVTTLAHNRQLRFTPADWKAIRAYREPRRAAICTLYGHNLTIEQIEQITIKETHEALTSNHINNQPLTPDGRAYLHATILHRAIYGASPTESLITGATTARTITKAAKEIGLLISTRPNQHSIHTTHLWKAQFGFQLTTPLT